MNILSIIKVSFITVVIDDRVVAERKMVNNVNYIYFRTQDNIALERGRQKRGAITVVDRLPVDARLDGRRERTKRGSQFNEW